MIVAEFFVQDLAGRNQVGHDGGYVQFGPVREVTRSGGCPGSRIARHKYVLVRCLQVIVDLELPFVVQFNTPGGQVDVVKIERPANSYQHHIEGNLFFLTVFSFGHGGVSIFKRRNLLAEHKRHAFAFEPLLQQGRYLR